MVVYLMIGIAGSGKSTYIKNNLPNIKVISRDLARVELGYCSADEKYNGTFEEEKKVTDYCNRQMLECAKRNEDFVIDNTHLRRKYRNNIKELLKDYNVSYVYIVMQTPKEIAIERRKKDGFGDMAESIIDKMADNYESPTKEEYDKIIFV